MTVSLIVLSLIGLLAGGLIANRPPILDPPGFWARLATYLGTHVAETRADHLFPELRPRVYPLPPDALYAATRDAIGELGWTVRAEDVARLRLEAVVTSALWRFKDDVVVRIEQRDAGSTPWLSARSRIGRGDLAANTRHLLDLHAALERRLPHGP